MKLLAAGLALNLVASLYAVTAKQVNPYDPGICTSKNRGKIVVVKGRNEDDIIVACVERNHGKYQWDTIKGYSYGNYFDPAKDCSHVVDSLPKATSRVYWIQTENGPKKAWCDVDTDGGGFMLIGINNKPEAWAIPSKSSLVHPHGDSIWSSAFGGQKVLDFRVQISMTKDFQDTRAHWYYRFQTPRNLSKLLMSDEGGCNHQYPGIGHVAYVKDLITRNIATKNFQCSRFGASIAPGLGWDKMNKCFNQPCPYGFAYLHNYHIDRSGSYSYSAVSASSGIQNNQASFVGCDHGECCACFGPDSKKDYCAPRCKAINGGTVLREKDNITVWFWIRSSLPKRVWRRCMEFKEQNGAGKLETWRVQDGIKRKGPCSDAEDVTVNDGVAVVSNNETMNKLPKIEGLLSYRSDDRKLYFKEKFRWKALATKEEVTKKATEVIKELERFKQKIGKEVTSFKKDLLAFKSCKQIWTSQSNNGSGVYKIRIGTYQSTNVYCQMSYVGGCSGGGWTMVMKINGASSTFLYNSSYWTNKNTYQDHGLTGFDNRELKGSTYWRTSFEEICVAMKYNGTLRATSFKASVSSLYSLITAGFRVLDISHTPWKRVVDGSSLKYDCTNYLVFNWHITRSRLSVFSVPKKDGCFSPDSSIALGLAYQAGIVCRLDLNPNRNTCRFNNSRSWQSRAMGYILVR